MLTIVTRKKAKNQSKYLVTNTKNVIMTLGANLPNHLYLGILGLKTRNGMAKVMPEKSTGGALAKTSEAASSKDFPYW